MGAPDYKPRKNGRGRQKTYNNALKREIHPARLAFFCLFEFNP